MEKPKKYQVIVGNVGTIYYGNNRCEAERLYDLYCSKSLNGEGRASGEAIVLMKNGEPVKELTGEHD